MSNFIPFGNPGLFDEFVQNLDVAAFETPLMRVGKLVRWEVFEPHIIVATGKQANVPWRQAALSSHAHVQGARAPVPARSGR